MYIYVYIYMYIYVYIYVYICIYIYRQIGACRWEIFSDTLGAVANVRSASAQTFKCAAGRIVPQETRRSATYRTLTAAWMVLF